MTSANLGWTLLAQNRVEEAEPLFRESLSRSRQLLGEDHPDTLMHLCGSADVARAQGNWREAEAAYLELAERARRILGADHPETELYTIRLARVLREQEKFVDAEALLLAGLERTNSSSSVSARRHLNWIKWLVGLYDDWNKPDEAAKWRAELAALEAATRPATQPPTQPATQPN